MLLILQLVYLMLPAYIANMTPVFARHVPILNYPVDLGAYIRGRRVFGANKTWRGLIFGMLAGILISYIQSVVDVGELALVNYNNWILIGVLLSTGALLGDLIKSFFKRQLDIPRGESFIPFDQIDYAIGALLLLSIIYFPGWINSAIILLISVALHFATNIIGYYLNIRSAPW